MSCNLRPCWAMSWLALAICFGCQRPEHGGAAGGSPPASGPANTAESASADEAPKSVTLSPEAVETHQIRTEPATLRPVHETLRLPGRVALNAGETALVVTPVTGRIRKLSKDVGDDVSAGETLALVESPEFSQAQGDFLEKRTAVASASSALEVAQKAADRAQKLYEQQGISEGELEKRQAELSAAKSASAASTAALAAAQSKLALLGLDETAVEALQQQAAFQSTYRLRAPIDGQVVDRQGMIGEAAGPDREAVFVLSDTHHPWVLVDLPQDLSGEVHPGAAARVEGPNGSAIASGRVERISPTLDADLRTSVVRIVVEESTDDAASRPAAAAADSTSHATQPRTSPATEPASKPTADATASHEGAEAPVVRPGMFVTVLLDLGEAAAEGPSKRSEVLSVPESAVLRDDEATFVFVAGDTPNTFVRREVKLGDGAGGYVPVRHGLKPAEPVVVSGAFVLRAELEKEPPDE